MQTRLATLFCAIVFFFASLARADNPLTTEVQFSEVSHHCHVTLIPVYETQTGYVPIRVIFYSYVDNPIKFGVPPTLPGPAPRDRVIEFALGDLEGAYSAEYNPNTWSKITIPKGAISAETIITVPQYANANLGFRGMGTTVTLREKGKRTSTFSSQTATTSPFGNGRNTNNDGTQVSTLFIHSQCFDAATRLKLLSTPPNTFTLQDPKTHNYPGLLFLLDAPFADINEPLLNTGWSNISDWETVRHLASVPHWSAIPPSEVPDDWIQLSSRSLVIISASELESLATKHPQKAEAIFSWLSTGTGMIVYGAGENFSQIGKIEKALKLAPLPLSKAEKPPTDQTFVRAEWNLLNPLLPDLDSAQTQAANQARPYNSRYPQYGPLKVSDNSYTAQEKPPFQSRSRLVGLGMLIAIDSEKIFPDKSDIVQIVDPSTIPGLSDAQDRANSAQTPSAGAGFPAPLAPFPPPVLNFAGGFSPPSSQPEMFPTVWKKAWLQVYNNIGHKRLHWEQRTDLDLRTTSDFYWNMLIPGVGASPVISFLVLVTFFVILIGPINFSWARRRKRPVLLLLTVPIAGALATVLLFFYAVVSDGFSTRSRVHSYTYLDQQRKHAISWSRQSYYAAVAPSGGYEFTKEQVIFPITNDPLPSNYNQSSSRTLRWEDEKQQLEGGYIRSRSFSQLMVIHSNESKSQLLVTPASANSAPKVTNRLAKEILLLYLCDQNGDYFLGTNISQEESQSLTLLPPVHDRRDLEKIVAASALAMPAGFDPSSHDQGLFGNNYRRYYNDSGRSGDSIGVLAAKVLKSNSSPNPAENYFLSGIGGPRYGIQKREFIAIVTDPLDVPMGLKGSHQIGSEHIICGNW